MANFWEIKVATSKRTEMVDITSQIANLIQKSDIKQGICYIYCPHTTAGLTINENADPTVVKDILYTLNKLIPIDRSYLHQEGNSDAHIKASLVGSSETVFVQDGKLALGTWQGIYFCEFDGPRSRRVWVKLSS